MFTGLIREIGSVASLERRGAEGLLKVSSPLLAREAAPGDSIAVDGACLTVEKPSEGEFTAFLSAETLAVTTLGALRPGDRVHLEPSLRLSDRLDGHFMQGHVEGVGEVLSLDREGRGFRLALLLPAALEELVVPKGSIALAGVSLTAAACDGRRIEVAVVPGTIERTALGSWRAGTRVNVETDILGRYVLAFLKRRGEGRLTLESLLEKGF